MDFSHHYSCGLQSKTSHKNLANPIERVRLGMQFNYKLGMPFNYNKIIYANHSLIIYFAQILQIKKIKIKRTLKALKFSIIVKLFTGRDMKCVAFCFSISILIILLAAFTL